MGVYDKEVIEVIGSGAFEYLREKVKRGIISAQQMKDILHDHVFGKHQERLDSGGISDEAEFRSTLCDLHNVEMCDTTKQRKEGGCRDPKRDYAIYGWSVTQKWCGNAFGFAI